MTIPLEFTGERMVPESADAQTYWEHVFRYAFACKSIANLDVLDIASGEGYGTYALSKVAKSAVGVDISAEAIEHARLKYNIDYRLGSAETIPVDRCSIDAVISFETIEHVPQPEKFIHEVFRVLRPGGTLIISTPNKDMYLKGQSPNPFHCSELTKTQFLNLLNPFFERVAVWGQIFRLCPLDDLQRFIGRLSNRLAFYLRRRLEKALRDRFIPDSVVTDAAKRLAVIESIPTYSPPLSGLWNPYAIRKLDDSILNQPTYFVAVARRRKERLQLVS